jgi:Tol biopolymer transport system component
LTFADGGQSPAGGARVGARVFIANLDGSEVREIGAGDCPSWSPDGTKIACCFVDPARPAPLLHVIDVTTGVETTPGYGWWRANWSADSKSLYANSLGPANSRGLFKLGLDERQQPEPIFASISGAESPCESYDGGRVVFAARASK